LPTVDNRVRLTINRKDELKRNGFYILMFILLLTNLLLLSYIVFTNNKIMA